MDQRAAAKLRGIAKQYAAIGVQIKRGANQRMTNRWTTELATEVLDALGTYENAAHFLTFISGPVQHYFIQRYSEEIQADSDRQTLRMFDDPDTKREAVGRAVATGRVIELTGDKRFWQFRRADTPLELIQWAHGQGVAPGSDPGTLSLVDLEGLKRAIVAEALHGPESHDSEEEPSGQYL